MISDSFTKESIQLSDSIRSDFQLDSQENAVFNQIDWTKCPRHIAIIMDGNGRWAKQRGKLRTTGHKAGVQSVYEVVETCGKIPTEYVTFYAFSTENWRRSESEVNALMGLFSSSLIKYIDRLEKDGVNLRVIGDLSRMGSKIQEEFKQAQNRTLDNNKICMTLALNYSGRADIVRATKDLAEQVSSNKLACEDITEEMISESLYTKFCPDPELLIRTSGECRISNFLLWELAYSELYFTDIHWPDFRKLDLFKAILNYQQRDRRFGGVGSVTS